MKIGEAAWMKVCEDSVNNAIHQRHIIGSVFSSATNIIGSVLSSVTHIIGSVLWHLVSFFYEMRAQYLLRHQPTNQLWITPSPAIGRKRSALRHRQYPQLNLTGWADFSDLWLRCLQWARFLVDQGGAVTAKDRTQAAPSWCWPRGEYRFYCSNKLTLKWTIFLLTLTYRNLGPGGDCPWSVPVNFKKCLKDIILYGKYLSSNTQSTGLGFVCFVVLNPYVLSANRVDLGFFVS